LRAALARLRRQGYGDAMLIADIHHVSINVSDTSRALAFYRDALGMTVLPRPDVRVQGAWLETGGGRQLHLIEAEVPPNHGQHVAFLVDDLDAVVERLQSAGYAVSAPKPVGDTRIRQAFLEDPDGNLIELSHR
jgi:catechol 2,3-dioxygenase-like lactoylglutathione lyase family enzyme